MASTVGFSCLPLPNLDLWTFSISCLPLDVLYLNNERRKFFQDLLAGNIPTLRKALEERDDEVIRLFDDIPSIDNDTSTNNKKPRLFKNGIL